MSNTTFTLDDIRAAADRNYGAVDFDLGNGRTCRLVNALRLPKAKRDALLKTQDRMKADSADQEKELIKALKLVAEDEAMADELLESFKGDLAMLATVFDFYTKGSEAGEA